MQLKEKSPTFTSIMIGSELVITAPERVLKSADEKRFTGF